MDIVTQKQDGYQSKPDPSCFPILQSLFCLDITLGSQKLCTENCAACCAADGVVGKSYELVIVDAVLTDTAYGNTHAVLIIDIQRNLRTVIFL